MRPPSCDEAAATSATSARPDRPLLWLLLCVLINAATESLALPLLNLRLDLDGASALLIGLVTALPALAMILLPPLVPALIARLGALRFLQGCLILSALCLALFPQVSSLVLWFALRFTLALSLTGQMVMFEAWIGHLSEAERRSRGLALYAMTFSTGLAIGPGLLQVTGIDGLAPFVTAAGLMLFCLVPLNRAGGGTPPFAARPKTDLVSVTRHAPLAIVAAALFGAIETGVLALMPVWGVRNDLTPLDAAGLMIWIGLGNILLQWPIGWLADHWNRRHVMALIVTAGLAGALALPVVLHSLWLYPVLFLWGGAVMGLYTVALSHIGAEFAGSDLAVANAAVVASYGAGAIGAPLAFGGALDWSPRAGMPLVLGLGCAAFLLFALWERRRAAVITAKPGHDRRLREE